MSVDSHFDLLQIPGLVVTDVQSDAFSYLIIAEPANPPAKCAECDSSEHLKRGKKSSRTYRDTTLHDKKCRVEVRRRWWRCASPGCGSYFVPEVPGMEPNHSMTRRLATHIRREALSHPFRKVAASVGCDEALVRDLFHEQIRLLDRHVQFETPEWMGIDEVHIHRKYICVVTNLHRRTVVAVLEDKTRDALFKYLANLKDRDRIRLISTDMDEMYRAAARLLLPDATVVLDRFHIIARATQAVSKLIDDVRRTPPPRMNLDGLIKDKWALLKRRDRCSGEEFLFADMWRRSFPQIEQACEMLQAFYQMWDECQTPREARACFAGWRKRVSKLTSDEARDAFRPLLKLFAERSDDIFSYFGTRLTNAYTEQANRRIRDINRMGRGYKFEVLRAKILYGNIFRLSPRYQRPSGVSDGSSFDFWANSFLEWQEERERRFPAPPELLYRQLPTRQRRQRAKETPPLFAAMDEAQLRLFGEEFVNYGVPAAEVLDGYEFDEEVA